MITSVAPLIIALFALTGGYYLVRLVRDRTWDDRILDTTHLLMSVLMIMMPLGVSTRIPAAVQILVFTAAALWYAYLILFRPSAVSETVGSHHSGRPRLLYHAGMMLAMVWMAVIMAPLPGTGAAGVQSMPSMSMPSMSMPGMSMAGTGAAPTAADTAVHGWSDPVSIMIGIGFAVATIWYAVRFVLVGGSPGPTDVRKLADNGAAALMAAGMALSNLVVIT